ncbi:hypothetical protein BFS35_006800 [Macrococcoides goetzii]|uniref:Uncharacterized protein n=1 Tax=Macrococcoides goetzii TaxID=1891097 RepID=A0A395GB86_9STAP|nr:hypothetical protein [Macrococcus goetzii]RAI81270.1 hypothetical protein BFS35_006800 [Macrococcus goetzii]
MKQFTFKRTVLAWYNIRIAGQDEVIATLPLDAMKKLVNGFTGNASIGCFEADIRDLRGLLR